MADIKTVLIGTLLIFGVGVGIFNFAGELFTEYGITPDSDFSRTESKLQSSFGNSSSLSNQLQDKVAGDEGFNLIDGFLVLGSATLAALKLPFQAIGLIITVLSDISLTIGLPAWILPTIIGVITIVIVTAVLSAILRKDV